jgi:hypothetical protein
MVKKMPDKEVLKILHASTRFRTDVSLLILRFEPAFLVKLLTDIAQDVERGKVLQVSQGTSAIVLVCEETAARNYAKRYRPYVFSHKDNLAAIVLMSPKKIVDTPGVLEFILNRFKKKGINLVEIIGSYTDTTFIVGKQDLYKAMDLLSEFVA